MISRELHRPLYDPLHRDLDRVRDSVGGGPSYDPDALDYFTRAEALDADAFDLTATVGGLTPEATKSIWNTFILSLKSDGTWDDLDEICPLSGVSFTAITAKVKYSGTSTTTLSNFVSGDYNPAGAILGLKGDGSTKEINSNWSPSDTITLPSAHHSLFTTELATTVSREGSRNDDDQTLSCYVPFTTLVISDAFSVSGGRISATENEEGFVLMNCTGSANRLLIEGNLEASGASPTGLTPTADYYFFSIGGMGYSDGRRSIRTMGQGLTESQEETLSNAILALMMALGYGESLLAFAGSEDEFTGDEDISAGAEILS